MYFEDGDSELYNLVVGADGIHSASENRYLERLGYETQSRGVGDLSPKRPDGLSKNAITEYFGLGKRVGYMPIGDDKIYIYML